MASMHLADMGATVIKIEDKGACDYARTMSHVRHELSQLFIAVNRGKQCIQLDLKDDADRADFIARIQRVDVLVESFRPGVMKKLELGWELLHALNPKLVLCSISGCGQEGPTSQVAGHDINSLADAGVLVCWCAGTKHGCRGSTCPAQSADCRSARWHPKRLARSAVGTGCHKNGGVKVVGWMSPSPMQRSLII